MAVKRLFNDRHQFFDGNGDPLDGGQLFVYLAGSSTKSTSYNSSSGLVGNSNPLVLNSAGRLQPEVWVTTGLAYKLVLASSTDSDPPTSPFWTEDEVSGINDSFTTFDEFVSGPAPTYVSSTSFTVVGDQTSVLTVGRRVKITDSGGTKFGTIKTSVFGALTTITLDSQDSDALATPASALSYGILNPANTSHPVYSDALAIVGGSADRSKRVRLEVDGLTTATTRVWTAGDGDVTFPNYTHRVMSQTHGADIASAGTVDLDAATGDLVDVTGTTAITAITLADGKMATVRFTGALILTNGASLVLPGAANITTAAGDFAIFRGYAAGVVRCASYVKANGTPIINANGTAITLGTEQATTSGTAIDFTSVPSWVKRINIQFVGVSTNGTSHNLIQIGDSGGVKITNYFCSAGPTAQSFTTGFGLNSGLTNRTLHGTVILTLEDATDNTWCMCGVVSDTTNTNAIISAGSLVLGAVLDRVRITTVNGTDAFDAGVINISYE